MSVLVQVDGADGEEDLELAARLRLELLDLDVEAVGQAEAGDVPEGSKGVAALAASLVVSLGAGGLRPVIDYVRGWAARNRRDVEVTMDGDTLKLSGVSAEQQGQIIDAWLSRHS